MMEPFPEGLTAYRRSPIFDETSLPAALQREHRTKAGAWALIHVLEGRLLYRILEPFSDQELAPGRPGVVRLEQPHEVHPVGPVRMFVEFYSADPGQAGKPRSPD